MQVADTFWDILSLPETREKKTESFQNLAFGQEAHCCHYFACRLLQSFGLRATMWLKMYPLRLFPAVSSSARSCWFGWYGRVRIDGCISRRNGLCPINVRDVSIRIGRGAGVRLPAIYGVYRGGACFLLKHILASVATTYRA